MELSSINDAFDRVTKKQKLSSSKVQEIIEQIGREIEQAISRIQSEQDSASPSDQKMILNELKAKLKEIAPLRQLEGPQKELNVALSKYTKMLEKSFTADISKSCLDIDFDLHTVNQILASHLYREGLFDVGDCFVSESNEPGAATDRAPFLELFQILEAMKSRNLEPALKWVKRNCEELIQHGSELELKLHRLQFVEILQNKSRDEALKYGRAFLAPFAATHMADVQKLMTALLWADKLDSSPYAELLSSTHWSKMAEELTREFCNFMEQSHESPLSVTIAAGILGLPYLLKMSSLTLGKNLDPSSVDLKLGVEFQFHSVFVCHVSKEHASADNPPMILTCGHVICKQTMTKLTKNNNTKPFKCPYCPIEVEVAQCRQLFL
ncbi:hypothetical protein ABFX02_08G062400 [Erythranthe guttata]